VLVYREPTWYLGPISAENFIGIPAFCKRNSVSHYMEVYGVGDHGGGPTRRDLERLTDMMDWPVFPTIKFSTFHNYFDAIKPQKDTFPVVEHELNFIFTGCYTSQSRIKAANRLGEATLYEAEALAALTPTETTVDHSLFEEAWRDVLFNHFHDIIPGSGVIDTREHASALFQNVLANANSQKGIVCYAISDLVDTSCLTQRGRGRT
jgi:alpha-mannosidase